MLNAVSSIDRPRLAMKTAVYPGTFDPVTNGHLDVIKRATHLFDKVVVSVVAENQHKQLWFPLAERLELIRENLTEGPTLQVSSFNGLLVDFAKQVGAVAIVRGLRAISDFEYDFQMTQMNRFLEPQLETVFLMPTQSYLFTSSSLIKDLAYYTDRLTEFVPPNVAKALRAQSIP